MFGALRDIRQEERARDERLARQQREQTRRVEAMEAWLTSLERQVAASGQGGAGGLGWSPALSAAHLADLRALLRSLERTTGSPQTALEQEVIDTFGVAAINAIPDDLWHHVLAWYCWRAQESAPPRFNQ